MATDQIQKEAAVEEEKHEPFYLSWRRILFTTHHTDIGVLYMAMALFFLVLAGVAALVLRAELSRPGNIITPGTYNSLFTVHGTSMLFLWIIPVFAGFGNWLVPKMIGAKDLYYPKLNSIGFWILLPAGTLIWLGAPGIGWTGYAPLSIQEPGYGVDFWILGLHLVGTSSIIGAFNFTVTILKMRKPSLPLAKMPLFAWSILITSLIILGATPVLAMALTLLLLDRNFGTSFFLASQGGDPILWQHLFWFYSHPAVYIMILPGMGLASEIISKLSRKQIYGYKSMVISMALIAVFGYAVWAHHMFTTGISITARLPFMYMTLAVAVPSGIKVFNWVATLYGGRLKLNTPMLFAVSFVGTFVGAGVTGVYNGSIPVDYMLHDTYWVVGHLHQMLLGSSTQAVFAAFYYYFPHMTGRKYSEGLGQLHFVVTTIGMNMLLLSMLGLGLAGMPRRTFDYLPEFAPLNVAATAGALMLGIGVIVFLYNMIRSWLSGPRAEEDPWGAKKYGLPDFP